MGAPTEIVEVHAARDKRSRAVAWAAMLARGEAWFPRAGAPLSGWLKPYADEHVSFTGEGKAGTHDDQADTGSYFAAYVLDGGASGMTARASF